jgi:hypothetical protein
LLLFLSFGDWEEKRRRVSFVFCGEREAKNQKKNQKSLSFFGLHFQVKRATQEEKKAISSLPNCFSPGPSVVEEEEDLEDLHHHGDL